MLSSSLLSKNQSLVREIISSPAGNNSKKRKREDVEDVQSAFFSPHHVENPQLDNVPEIKVVDNIRENAVEHAFESVTLPDQSATDKIIEDLYLKLRPSSSETGCASDSKDAMKEYIKAIKFLHNTYKEHYVLNNFSMESNKKLSLVFMEIKKPIFKQILAILSTAFDVTVAKSVLNLINPWVMDKETCKSEIQDLYIILEIIKNQESPELEPLSFAIRQARVKIMYRLNYYETYTLKEILKEFDSQQASLHNSKQPISITKAVVNSRRLELIASILKNVKSYNYILKYLHHYKLTDQLLASKQTIAILLEKAGDYYHDCATNVDASIEVVNYYSDSYNNYFKAFYMLNTLNSEETVEQKKTLLYSILHVLNSRAEVNSKYGIVDIVAYKSILQMLTFKNMTVIDVVKQYGHNVIYYQLEALLTLYKEDSSLGNKSNLQNYMKYLKIIAADLQLDSSMRFDINIWFNSTLAKLNILTNVMKNTTAINERKISSKNKWKFMEKNEINKLADSKSSSSFHSNSFKRYERIFTTKDELLEMIGITEATA